MPVSVLRERGSSACLKSFDLSQASTRSPERKNKVTVINTHELPNYSTERYYMLSEIQIKAHSITFLRDMFRNDDDTQDLSASSTGSAANDENENDRDNVDDNIDTTHPSKDQGNSAEKNILPPFIILYLLWSEDSAHGNSSQSFKENVIEPCVDQIMELHHQDSTTNSPNVNGEESSKSKPPIYLVVDRLINPLSKDNKDSEDAHRKEQVALTEDLIRRVASCKESQLRSLLEGVTVGLSDNSRAAPGLETCMDAIVVGDAERRHFPKKRRQDLSVEIIRNHIEAQSEADPGKSCIGIVTEYPDDLTGLDPSGETDAVQGLALHARSVGNWGGNGNILNFAARSQKEWREKWEFAKVIEKKALSFDFWTIRSGSDLDTVGNSYSILGRRRRKRRGNSGNGIHHRGNANTTKYLPSKRLNDDVDQIANMMIIGFFSFILTIVLKQYPDEISQITNMLQRLMGIMRQ